MQLGEKRTAGLTVPQDHPYNRLPILANFPPPMKPTWFQKGLDKIGGKEVNGKPRFRIVWGQDPENLEWDPYNQEWRGKYIYSSTTQPVSYSETDTGLVGIKMEKFDVCWPRWWVEYFIPPEVACRGHSVRGKDEDGAEYYDPLPTEGLYFPQLEICEHTEDCCAQAKSQSLDCHGFYRDPAQADLDLLSSLVQARDRERENRSGEKTQSDYERITKQTEEKKEKWREGLSERMGAITKAAVVTHSAMFSEDPTVRAWGKFHLLGGHSKSGLKTGTSFDTPEGESDDHAD